MPCPFKHRSLKNRNVIMSDVLKKIQDQINSDSVVLYMKGNAQFPMCGFSGTVVQILKHLTVPFTAIDVMQDMEIREGIKQFSNWPTIPQLYVKGEFIGGCDIIREMFETAELQVLLEERRLIKGS